MAARIDGVLNGTARGGRRAFWPPRASRCAAFLP